MKKPKKLARLKKDLEKINKRRDKIIREINAIEHPSNLNPIDHQNHKDEYKQAKESFAKVAVG